MSRAIDRPAGDHRRAFLARLLAAVTGSALLGKARPSAAAPEGTGQPYIGEIRLFGGDYAPIDWLKCEGQIVSIASYENLFYLIGTTYGGDGQVTFGIPDLRGRAPIHVGNGLLIGQTGGLEQHVLTAVELPAHTHGALAGSGVGSSADPAGLAPARNAAGVPTYAAVPDTSLGITSTSTAGDSQPHPNMQPWLAMTFIICYAGVYPSPT